MNTKSEEWSYPEVNEDQSMDWSEDQSMDWNEYEIEVDYDFDLGDDKRDDFYREVMAYDPVVVKPVISTPKPIELPKRGEEVKRSFISLPKKSVVFKPDIVILQKPTETEKEETKETKKEETKETKKEETKTKECQHIFPRGANKGQKCGGVECQKHKPMETKREETRSQETKENKFVPDPEIAPWDPRYKVTPISARYRVQPLVEVRVKNRICRFGTECRCKKTCPFAHDLKKLVPEKCSFGCRCRDVVVCKGVVVNKSPDRVCYFQHAETVKQYVQRVGVGVY